MSSKHGHTAIGRSSGSPASSIVRVDKHLYFMRHVLKSELNPQPAVSFHVLGHLLEHLPIAATWSRHSPADFPAGKLQVNAVGCQEIAHRRQLSKPSDLLRAYLHIILVRCDLRTQDVASSTTLHSQLLHHPLDVPLVSFPTDATFAPVNDPIEHNNGL